MYYKHVFWDWNGTLINDAHTAYKAVNKMLSVRNLRQISFCQYREYVDVPISLFYEKVMDMAKETMEGLSVEYNGLWRENLPLKPLTDGIDALLQWLNSIGVKQYIFSSSQNKYIEPYLKKLGIDKYFTSVIAATDCSVGSKTERTKQYLLDNSIDPKTAVFIGDMYHDSEVASAIGSDCILVAWGHQCASALQKANCGIASDASGLKLLLQNNHGVRKC